MVTLRKSKVMKRYSRFKTVLLTVLLVNALLVATHEGEFWPFSIFPMFSQAGNPWTRAMVERVEDRPADLWAPRAFDELATGAVALGDRGVDAIDFANFISKTREWTPRRVAALRTLLGADSLGTEQWMVVRVDGYLSEQDSVIVEGTPLFLLQADTTLSNPRIFD